VANNQSGLNRRIIVIGDRPRLISNRGQTTFNCAVFPIAFSRKQTKKNVVCPLLLLLFLLFLLFYYSILLLFYYSIILLFYYSIIPIIRRVRDYGFLHGNAKTKLRLVQRVVCVIVELTVPRPRPVFKCPHCQAPMTIVGFIPPHWNPG
jgi:hypothetical protein